MMSRTDLGRDASSCACLQSPVDQFRRRRSNTKQCANPLSTHLTRSRTADDSALDRGRHGDGAGGQGLETKGPLARLCVQFRPTKYAAGRLLFRQGDVADAIFFISRGRVHRTIMTEKGDDHLVAILGAGDFCGEECLSPNPHRTMSAVAVDDSEIVRIEKSVMHDLRRNWPDFDDAFMSFLLKHGLETEAALIDQLVGSVEQRLGRVLLKLANVSGKAGEVGVVSNVKQEMLAGLVGTTRPHINHFLNKFRRLGLIAYGSPLEPGVIKVNRHLRQVCGGE